MPETIDSIRAKLKPEKIGYFADYFINPDYCPQTPFAKQLCFLMAQNREVFYGGAAGGGKTEALLMGALRFIDVPGFNAILFRRSYPELNAQEGLIARLRLWIGPAIAKGLCDYNASEHRLTIHESGATIAFGFIDNDADCERKLGSQVQYVAFDELTGFTEYQYTYMFSRLRAIDCPACKAIKLTEYSRQLLKLGPEYQLDYVTQAILRDGKLPQFIDDKEKKEEPLVPELARLSRAALSAITPKAKRMMLAAPPGTIHKPVAHMPLQMRATSNPGFRGHEWVKAYFIDDGQVDPTTERGKVGHGGSPCDNGPKDCRECGSYYERNDWQNFPDQRCPKDGAALTQGRFFIPAFHHDNAHIKREEYRANLLRLDKVRGEQMLHGNWDIVPKGDLFDCDKIKKIGFDELPTRSPVRARLGLCLDSG